MLQVAALTGVGLCRNVNEDTFGISQPGSALFRGPPEQRLELRGPVVVGVYDGTGSLISGEAASGTVARAVHEIMSATPDGAAETLGPALVEAVRIANRRLFDLVMTNAQWRGLGTTATVAVIGDNWVVVAHVGDTRAYRRRGNDLRQITRDDSLANDLLDAGLAELPADFAHHHVITKALGFAEDLSPASYATDLQDGDMIVLCSDGVWGMIGEPAMRDILLGSRDPEQTCRALIEAADQAGGHDNATVVSVLVRSRR